MSDITITLNTDNDAFYDDEVAEVARILRDAAAKIEQRPLSQSDEALLRDINGNTVGQITVTLP